MSSMVARVDQLESSLVGSVTSTLARVVWLSCSVRE